MGPLHSHLGGGYGGGGWFSDEGSKLGQYLEGGIFLKQKSEKNSIIEYT